MSSIGAMLHPELRSGAGRAARLWPPYADSPHSQLIKAMLGSDSTRLLETYNTESKDLMRVMVLGAAQHLL